MVRTTVDSRIQYSATVAQKIAPYAHPITVSVAVSVWFMTLFICPMQETEDLLRALIL